VRPLPNRLVETLTAQRTMAIQECLAAKPDVAVCAVAHALALRIFYRQEFNRDTCLGLEAKIAELSSLAPSLDESRAGQSLARRHEEWARKLPAESGGLWDWIALQDAETRLALLAYCAARTVDAVQRSWEQRSRAQHHAEQLSRAVALDMAAWWAVTRESYLAHVPKALILEAVREGVSQRDADGLTGLKKDAMIEHAERLLAGRGWLPEVLRSEAGAMPAERSA
jgi:ParB family chromosome partitioning protein